MPNPKIWKPSEINLEDFQFKKKVGRVIPITYQHKPLYIVLPQMEYVLPVTYQNIRITLLFKEGNNSTYKLFKSLDDWVPKTAYEHREDWFAGDEMIMDMEFSEFFENFHQQIQICKNKDNRECVRFGMPFDINKALNRADNKPLIPGLDPIQELAFGRYKIAVLLKCQGVWVNEEAYGISWKIYQMKIFDQSRVLPMGCKFLSDIDAVRSHEVKPLEVQVTMPTVAERILTEPDGEVSKVNGDSSNSDKPLVNYLLDD